MDQVSILLDLVVAALLVATIVYATVLNRKLAALRDNKQEMEAMVTHLVRTTEQAERGLADLKAAAGEKGDELEKRVKDATALVDDLGFLVDKGGSVADRLERQIGEARGTGDGAGRPARGEAAPADTTPAQKPDAPKRGGGKSKSARRNAAGGKPANADAETPHNDKLLKALRGVR